MTDLFLRLLYLALLLLAVSCFAVMVWAAWCELCRWISSRPSRMSRAANRTDCATRRAAPVSLPGVAHLDYDDEAERARDDGYDSDRDERWLEAER
jgi:hypothetical protein